MDILYAVIIFVLVILGIVGSIMPIIPGPFVAFCGVLMGYFVTDYVSLTALILWGVGMAIVTIVDNFIPPLITKKYGGSKKAALGSFVGLLIGTFIFPPLGMVAGAFFGALLGEFMETKQLSNKEFNVAIGSFLGFILGTGIKLIYGIMLMIYLIFKYIP